jgi:hypothetical protein
VNEDELRDLTQRLADAIASSMMLPKVPVEKADVDLCIAFIEAVLNGEDDEE